MTAERLVPKVQRGFSIAGRVLGRLHDVYRPVGPTNPLTAANKIGTIRATFDARPSYAFTIPALQGDFLRYGLFDPTKVQVGDVMIGPAGTLVVAALPDYQPMPCVFCDAVVALRRLAGHGGFGGVEAPEGPGQEVDVFSGWPAAIVYAGRGGGGSEGLPGGSPPPQYEVHLPVVPGVSEPPRPGDIVTDGRGDRFEVVFLDPNALGWRLHVRRVLTT
jgi:hypothetical protein